MNELLYKKQKEKRERLINNVFDDIVKETISLEDRYRIKLVILWTKVWGTNRCTHYNNKTFKITIELEAIKKRASKGYSNIYYSDRKTRTDKYILHNRHNALRFVLYHEVKHASDRLKNFTEKPSEFDADSWAIQHLEGAK